MSSLGHSHYFTRSQASSSSHAPPNNESAGHDEIDDEFESPDAEFVNLTDFREKAISEGSKRGSRSAKKNFLSFIEEKRYGNAEFLGGLIAADKTEQIVKLVVVWVSALCKKEYKTSSVVTIVKNLARAFILDGWNHYLLDPKDKKTKECFLLINGMIKTRSREQPSLPKQAPPITVEEENALFEYAKQIQPEGARLNACMFLVLGLDFALRGGAYYSLQLTDFEFKRSEDGVRYIEFKEPLSKNNQGGVTDMHLSPRICRSFEHSDRLRSAPHLLERMGDTRPSGQSPLFLLPMKTVKKDGIDQLFHSKRLGKNALDSMLTHLCLGARIEPRTNHSLRRTTIVRLVDSGVDSTQVQVMTGHRSDSSVKRYIEQSEMLSEKRARLIRSTSPPRDEQERLADRLQTESSSSSSLSSSAPPRREVLGDVPPRREPSFLCFYGPVSGCSFNLCPSPGPIINPNRDIDSPSPADIQAFFDNIDAEKEIN